MTSKYPLSGRLPQHGTKPSTHFSQYVYHAMDKWQVCLYIPAASCFVRWVPLKSPTLSGVFSHCSIMISLHLLPNHPLLPFLHSSRYEWYQDWYFSYFSTNISSGYSLEAPQYLTEVLLMSTQNRCFLREIKHINTFWLKKKFLIQNYVS